MNLHSLGSHSAALFGSFLASHRFSSLPSGQSRLSSQNKDLGRRKTMIDFLNVCSSLRQTRAVTARDLVRVRAHGLRGVVAGQRQPGPRLLKCYLSLTGDHCARSNTSPGCSPSPRRASRRSAAGERTPGPGDIGWPGGMVGYSFFCCWKNKEF